MSRQYHPSRDTFMGQRGNNRPTGKRYPQLRSEGPEKQGPFGPAGMYCLLRSPSAYSLPYIWGKPGSGATRRVLLGGRFRRDTTTTMHERKREQTNGGSP